MCLEILFHNFYLAKLSFSIGFIIGFWNLHWSWIRLCRSSHLRGVLENRCSKIWSQNPWKIPMKKLIFSKVAGWQCSNFSCFPWGFYLIKKFVKIVFFASFFLRQKLLETGLCNFSKKGTSSKIFFKDFDWKFPLATFRTAVYKNIFFSRTSLWLLPNFV